MYDIFNGDYFIVSGLATAQFEGMAIYRDAIKWGKYTFFPRIILEKKPL